MENDDLKIPRKPATFDKIVTALQDEDFRFDTIKQQTKKKKFDIPAPTPDDEDNTESVSKVTCCILVARPNWYQSADDKKNDKPAKEKRVLYVLLPGKLMPMRIFVNPTSVKNWKAFIASLAKKGQKYYRFMVELGTELIEGKEFTWTKTRFTLGRPLTDEEMAHVEKLRGPLLELVRRFDDEEELTKWEAKAMAEDDDEIDDEDALDAHQKATKRAVEEDEEDEPKAKKAKKPAPPAEKEAKKPAKPADDDDDEDEEPKGKKQSRVDDDDDEDEEPKKKAPAAKDDDDEDVAELAGKGKKKPSTSIDDDDDDED